MCNPAESSQLYSEMKQHPELQEHFSHPVMSPKMLELSDAYESKEINESVAIS